MKKIMTIFDRNWESDRKINPKMIVDFNFSEAIATEKLDGMNIRLTVRAGVIVRVEKRRNPTKIQKQNGISNPWYVDALETDSQDKWIFDAVKNTDFSQVKDGEWSAEAIGRNIQGNPLLLDNNRVFIFSLPEWKARITLEEVPTTFEEIKAYLIERKSLLNEAAPIEGIVWHHPNGEMVKIKRKDFTSTSSIQVL